jgi:hypothetical protein
LGYTATRKLTLNFTADFLAVDIQDYSGVLQDIYFVFDYRLSGRFGLGAGINTLSLNVKVDNQDTLAELRHSYRGFIGAVSIYF